MKALDEYFLTVVLTELMFLQILCFSNTPHQWTDTQGCGAGLADAKLNPFFDITLFDTETSKTKVSA